MKEIMALVAIAAAAVVLAACSSDSPTEPPRSLTASADATVTPAAVSTDGTCTLELFTTTTGGALPYLHEWLIPVVRQSLSADGYPLGDNVTLTMPPFFVGGVTIDLVAQDQDGETDRAETTLTVDCTAPAVTRRVII